MSVEATNTPAAVVPETTPAVDAVPVAAAAPVVPSEQTAEAVAELPKTEEAPKTETAAEATDAAAAAAPVEDKTEAAVEDKVVEPIYSGALGYKAPGLKK
jgi:hypothetical protein